MPDLLLYFSTAACWLFLSGVAWRSSRPALAAGPTPRSEMRIEMVIVPVALVLHGMLLYQRVMTADGIDLGVANAVSMLVWLKVLIYFLVATIQHASEPLKYGPHGIETIALPKSDPDRG